MTNDYRALNLFPAAEGHEMDLQLFAVDPKDSEEELRDEIDLNEFFEGEEGEEEIEEEELEEEPEDDEEFDDPRINQAFAKRLAAKEAQIRRDLEQQYSLQTPKPQDQQTPPATPATPPPAALSAEQLEVLAENLGVTPQAADILYKQQMIINQQGEFIKNVQGMVNQMQDQSQLGMVKAQVEAQRATDPSLPAFDEKRIQKLRDEYQKRYNVSLPIDAAYNLMVAEDARSGKISRQSQQQTLKKVAKRQNSTVKKQGTQQAKKPNVWDLTEEQFEAMKDRAKQGGYKKR